MHLLHLHKNAFFGILAFHRNERKPMLPARSLTSSWALPMPYWIVISGPAIPGADWLEAAKSAGLKPIHNEPGLLALRTGERWAPEWQRVLEALESTGAHESLKAAIIASETQPLRDTIRFEVRNLGEIQQIANNLWLLDDLREDRLVCFMQRVMDRRGKKAGHEALVRIRASDGSFIGGGDIMRASYALKVEYHVDRRLHKQAIETFAQCGMEGFIFINFLTGFIHRPEIYLEGLSQAVEQHGITPHSVVLDVPVADYVRDMSKLRSIAAYCRTRGFSIALDDVITPKDLDTLLAEVKPTIVKLDWHLGAQILDKKRPNLIPEIISAAHAAGAMVLAEGVENEQLYKAYLHAGADMFQGYYFGAPEFMAPPDCEK